MRATEKLAHVLTIVLIPLLATCSGSDPTESDEPLVYSGPGMSRDDPAGIGQTVPVTITDFLILFGGTLQLTLIEVLSGDAALAKIRSWHPQNQAPPSGREYLLARFRVRVVRVDDCCSYYVTRDRFKAVDANDNVYPAADALVGMTPELKKSIPTGDTYEGYASFLVDPNDRSTLAVFDRDYFHRRFFKLR